jgi:hypothetical protein
MPQCRQCEGGGGPLCSRLRGKKRHCSMLLSIVISTLNPASTAFLNNSPFSIPAQPISGTEST